MEIDRRRRGRPVSDTRKNAMCNIRLGDKEALMLNRLCNEENKTRTEVLIEALKLKYEARINQEADELHDGYYDYDDQYYNYDDDEND